MIMHRVVFIQDISQIEKVLHNSQQSKAVWAYLNNPTSEGKCTIKYTQYIHIHFTLTRCGAGDTLPLTQENKPN